MKKIPSFFDLSGRVALVTGGGQNFGLEIAAGLAEAGADLAITSRELDKVKRAAAYVTGHNMYVDGGFSRFN